MLPRRLFFGLLLVILALCLVWARPAPQLQAQSVQSTVLVGRLWDGQNQSGTLLVNRYESVGCSSSTGYGNLDLTLSGINDRAESGSGYNGCNKLRVYEHINHGGATLTCSPSCNSFGVLNNQVSSYKLNYN
jgi:hypothetical protein